MNLIPRPAILAIFGVEQNTLVDWHNRGFLVHTPQRGPHYPIFYDPQVVQVALDRAKKVGTFRLTIESLLQNKQGLHATAQAAAILRTSSHNLHDAIRYKYEWMQALQIYKRWFLLDSCVAARARELGITRRER